jgi:integrase
MAASGTALLQALKKFKVKLFEFAKSAGLSDAEIAEEFEEKRSEKKLPKKWEDIKENKILVHSNYTLTHGYKNSTKTNRKRWVPLNTRCQEIMSAVSKANEYIFPWNRYAFQSYFYDRMKELHADKLIQNRYRPYDLRHTAISRWIEAQIPVAQVANWAGNSSEVIWKHYVNVTQEYEMPVL